MYVTFCGFDLLPKNSNYLFPGDSGEVHGNTHNCFPSNEKRNIRGRDGIPSSNMLSS